VADGPVFDPAIREFYARGGEQARLGQGVFQIERARTEELLLRYLPPAPARVLDVGGAAGAYACWLAERGYEVALFDPVPLHVEQARRACDGHRDRAITSAEVGDARALPVVDRSADAVLLLGPLYHLLDVEDRRRAWGEAHRALRPGGVVCAAAVSRFASLMDGLVRGYLEDPTFARFVAGDLRDGRHLNDTGHPEYFTTAYFHQPDELAEEARGAAFDGVRVFGIEGPGWVLGDFERRWSDAAWRERLLGAARAVEQEPAIIGLSAHLLAVGTRREGIS
jgi:ubiquinone/menaquinone biosynthesis C-methylase UbiE